MKRFLLPTEGAVRVLLGPCRPHAGLCGSPWESGTGAGHDLCQKRQLGPNRGRPLHLLCFRGLGPPSECELCARLH